MPIAVPISSPSSGGGTTPNQILVHTKALTNNASTTLFSLPLASNTIFEAFMILSIQGYDGTDLTTYVAVWTLLTQNSGGTISNGSSDNANAVRAVKHTGATLGNPSPTLSNNTDASPITVSLTLNDLGDAFGEVGAYLNVNYSLQVLTGQTITFL